MDFTEYTSVKNRFITTPNLCDLFKLLSIETWKRIEFAYLKQGIKVFETTITQNLIFTLNAYKDQYGLDIEIYEAADENKNGNDLELIIKYPSEGVEFYAPIQAKKVYKNGKYQSMEHGSQIESLITYANRLNTIPFYLLYNYTDTPLRTSPTLASPMELTGCTLISAKYLFDNYYNRRTNRNGNLAWIMPSFFDLNPSPSFPWHEIVCPPSSIGLFKSLRRRKITPIVNASESIGTNQLDATKLLQMNSNFRIGFLPIGTNSLDRWVNISRNIKFDFIDRDLGSRPMEIKFQQENENEIKEFSPKTRIEITV